MSGWVWEEGLAPCIHTMGNAVPGVRKEGGRVGEGTCSFFSIFHCASGGGRETFRYPCGRRKKILAFRDLSTGRFHIRDRSRFIFPPTPLMIHLHVLCSGSLPTRIHPQKSKKPTDTIAFYPRRPDRPGSTTTRQRACPADHVSNRDACMHAKTFPSTRADSALFQQEGKVCGRVIMMAVSFWGVRCERRR